MVTSYNGVLTASQKWSDLNTRTANSMQVLLDAIIANYDGKTDAMEVFDKTSKNAEKNPICAAVERGILASYGKKAVKLADTPTKELSDKDKATKRYNRGQVGSRASKVKIALDKRLNPDKYAKTKERTDDNIWLPTRVAELRKRIETSETYSGDLVELSEWMDACPISTPSE